jgi:hypothetical protein
MDEDKKKNGIEYLKAQGYKKISTKTFISDVELEHFLNKNFTSINKTFIQILEREYKVNLDELKIAYLEYQNSNKKPEPETLFTETHIEEKKIWQKYLPIVSIIVLLGVLAYYMFNSTNQEKKPNIDNLTTHIEENKSAIKKAQNNIEKLKLEEATKKEKTIDELEDDLDLDKIVLDMMKDRNLTSTLEDVDKNLSKEIKTLTTNKTAEIKAVPLEQTKPVEQTKPIEKIIPVEKAIPIAKTIPISKPAKKAKPNGNFFIIPTQKAWVGIIYLDDFSKKDFLIRSKLTLDPNRDQLIVVGHKHFMIYNKTYSVKFMGKGPVRFIYRDGELMEVSKKEFIRSGAGVAW